MDGTVIPEIDSILRNAKIAELEPGHKYLVLLDRNLISRMEYVGITKYLVEMLGGYENVMCVLTDPSAIKVLKLD